MLVIVDMFTPPLRCYVYYYAYAYFSLIIVSMLITIAAIICAFRRVTEFVTLLPPWPLPA